MASKKTGGDDISEIAGRMWEFLDKLAASDPVEYKKFIDQQLEDGKHMFIPPDPAYCLHCQVRAWEEVTCSLYVNVCKWTNVPKPKADKDPIPVKGGVLRYLVEEKTLKTTPSKDLVYDVAFHPSVVEECSQGPVMDTMLVALVLDYVEDRTELKVLDKANFKKLKALYKGPREDLQYSLDANWSSLLTRETKLDFRHSLIKQLHNSKTDDSADSSPLPSLILNSRKTTNLSSSSAPSTDVPTREKSKPLIEEISSQQAASSSCAKESGGGEEALCAPGHSVIVREADGKNPTRRVVVKVSLPGVTSASQVDLEVAKNDLQLSVKGQYQLSLQLPTPVDDDATKAKFTSKSSTLTITLPCL